MCRWGGGDRWGGGELWRGEVEEGRCGDRGDKAGEGGKEGSCAVLLGGGKANNVKRARGSSGGREVAGVATTRAAAQPLPL